MKPAFTEKQAAKMFRTIHEMEAALDDWIMVKKKNLRNIKGKSDDAMIGVWATVKQVRDVRQAFRQLKKIRKSLT